MRKTAALLASLSFLCAPVFGSGAALADQLAQSQHKVIECYCTGRQGERYELGDIICLTIGSRSYMAKCVMAQNNPFWRDQNMGCLSSSLEPRVPMTPKPHQLAFLTASN